MQGFFVRRHQQSIFRIMPVPNVLHNKSSNALIICSPELIIAIEHSWAVEDFY